MSIAASIPSTPQKNSHNFQVKIIQTEERYDGDLYSQRPQYDSTVWNSEVTRQISSQEWLKTNSLHFHRLDSKSLYPKLGFVHVEEFDPILKKPIRSRYGESLFIKYIRDDGKRMNIVANESALRQMQTRLQNRLTLFQQRFEWLTTSSRRMCGVIQERVVTIVFNINVTVARDFDQCIFLLERLLKEQVVTLDQFNLISCMNETPTFRQATVPVTKTAISEAIDWLWAQKCPATKPFVDISNALRICRQDTSNEAVYLFIEGSLSDKDRNILSQNATMGRPLHIIHYNSADAQFTSFLQEVCESTMGRFHAYSVSMSIDNYEGLPINEETQRADIAVRSRLYGGIVPGSTLREDCLLVFEEIESARQILSQIQYLLQQLPNAKMNYEGDFTDGSKAATTMDAVVNEDSMSSKEWLQLFGLKPRRLDFFDVLKGCIFKHCDGVVNIPYPPCEELNGMDLNEQQDAICEPKLINAKYCDKFAHVRWKDDTIVHVHVTSDVYRLYEKQMQVALSALKRRIDMLKRGSRELFGTITEDQVYILIDASASMEPSMTLVKDKMYILLQEQLRFKKSINFVAFNSKAYPWRDRLATVTDENIKSAWQWIRTQRCNGSTNTLAALRFALSDPKTEGVYLLTDGRPDQPTRTILAQVQISRRVPIHTISFNCADREANEFLLQLAQDSGGRFHVYHNTMFNSVSVRPEEHDNVKPWESEDIRLIKEEYQKALTSLERVGKLRDECFRLAWNKDTYQPGHTTTSNATAQRHRKCTIPRVKIDNHDIADRCAKESTKADVRTKSGPLSRSTTSRRPLNRPKAKNTFRKQTQRRRANSVDRIDLLSSVNASESESQNWIMPETREILDSQEKRYQDIIENHQSLRPSKEKPILVQTNPSARDISLSDWLKLNSLKEKKLTIFDALGPCTLHSSPRHDATQSEHKIDPETFQKLIPHRYFKENEASEHKSVVVPLIVDWPTYQEELRKMLQIYERKWIDIICKSFTEKQISSLIDAPAVCLSFTEHAEVFGNVAKQFKKAIKEPDFIKLHKELQKGWKYYKKSFELENTHREGDKIVEGAPNPNVEKHFFEEQETDSIVKVALSDDGIASDRNSQAQAKSPAPSQLSEQATHETSEHQSEPKPHPSAALEMQSGEDKSVMADSAPPPITQSPHSPSTDAKLTQ